MKVAELEGALLDYWVARAEGLEIDRAFEKGLHPHLYVFVDGDLVDFAPSSNWAQGGPIIDREGLELRRDEPNRWNAMGSGCYGDGHSPLIAAMRAYVASKFGEEVPDIDVRPESAG